MFRLLNIWLRPLRAQVSRTLRSSEFRLGLGLRAALEPVPRYTPGLVVKGGLRLAYADSASLLSAYDEIFINRIYDFPWSGARPPRILDLGANLGLASIWLARRYPGAKITALEPDAQLFSCLVENLNANGCARVRPLRAAVWRRNGNLRFRPEGADAGRVDLRGGRGTLIVPALAIAELLRGRPDMLKMDIEGAEEAVLSAARGRLESVRYLFVEYHGEAGKPQGLHRLLTLLAQEGYRVDVQAVHSHPSPFQRSLPEQGWDVQLNLFARRS